MFKAILPDTPTAPVLREQLAAAGDYMNGLRGVDDDKRDASWKADLRSAVDFIHMADPMLTALERSAPAPIEGPAGGNVPQNRDGSLGAQFVRSAEYTGAGEGAFGTANVEMEVRGNLFQGHEHRIDTGAGSAGAFLPQGQPIAPVPRQRRMFLRDVLDVVETGLASVPYIRETDPTASEFGASAVAEGTAKPQVAMAWSLDEAAVRKIAAWVEVTSEVLDDAPTVRGYIDGRLAYLLAIREEYEILNGSGTLPHLKGILQYSDIQVASGADHAAVLGQSIGKVENVDGEVNGIVINPLSYWTMITARSATQFDGQGTGSAPFGQAPTNIWGVTTIRSRALAQGKAIVGSWNMGATLFDRMSTRIVAGNQHSDYFVNNKVAILAEERVALAVHRPDFFVNVTLS